jgi:hypothetical protein
MDTESRRVRFPSTRRGDSDTDTDANCKSDSDSYCNGNRNTNTNTNTNSYCYGDAHSYSNWDARTYTEAYPNAKTSPESAASADTAAVKQRTSEWLMRENCVWRPTQL